jgi:hypothetical protein
MLWSEDVGPKMVDFSFSPTLSMGCSGSWSKIAQGCPLVDVPYRHVPSLLAMGQFIDSESLIGDGTSSDLEMVEAQSLFEHSSRWQPLASTSAGNHKNGSEFFYLLKSYLQLFFFSICYLVSMFI